MQVLRACSNSENKKKKRRNTEHIAKRSDLSRVYPREIYHVDSSWTTDPLGPTGTDWEISAGTSRRVGNIYFGNVYTDQKTILFHGSLTSSSLLTFYLLVFLLVVVLLLIDASGSRKYSTTASFMNLLSVFHEIFRNFVDNVIIKI